MNQASENRLARIHPELARRIRLVIDSLRQQGLVVEVVQGLRTFAEQDALYAQGRTKPGRRVTNAKGGQSNHNFGLAVDLCPFIGGKPNWNAPDEVWERIGTEAKAHGLEWGGDWKFTDKPHVQLPGLSVPECLKLYRQGGLSNVWTAINISKE